MRPDPAARRNDGPGFVTHQAGRVMNLPQESGVIRSVLTAGPNLLTLSTRRRRPSPMSAEYGLNGRGKNICTSLASFEGIDPCVEVF